MIQYLERDTSLLSQPEENSELILNENNWNPQHKAQLSVEKNCSDSIPKVAAVDRSNSVERMPLTQSKNKNYDNSCDEFLRFCCQELEKDQILGIKKETSWQEPFRNNGFVPSFRRDEIITMLSFANQLSLSPETVLTAVHYFDSVTCNRLVQPYMIPSYSAAALWLATKLHEREVFSSKYFLSYRSLMGPVSKKTLVEAESVILSTLGWKVNVTTTYHYIQIFRYLLHWLPKDFISMAESLCKYAMLEERLRSYSYSVQAASCISVSVRATSTRELYQLLLESLNQLSIPVIEVLRCSEILLSQTFGRSLEVKDQQMSPKSIRDWE